jgi:hypothetical protein
MEITPRLIISNGVELWDRLLYQPVCPEIAAQVLRSRIGEIAVAKKNYRKKNDVLSDL